MDYWGKSGVTIGVLIRRRQEIKAFPGGSVVKNFSVNAGHPGSIPASGRSLGEGNGHPLQHSCLEIPCTEEPGELQSMGLQRIGHGLAPDQQEEIKETLGYRKAEARQLSWVKATTQSQEGQGNGFSPQRLCKKSAPPTPWLYHKDPFCTSGIQDCKIINMCHFKSLNVW